MAISSVRESSGADTASHRDEDEDEKPRTLFVGNVPREVHKREIEEIFGEVGPLKRCYIQYPRAGNEKKRQSEDTTVAYVTFALSQDAVTALDTLHNSKIGSNKINIKFAKARSEQSRVTFGGGGRFPNQMSHRSSTNANFEPIAGAPPPVKEPRPKVIKKKSRLIVRNLSFKVTEEKMRKHFQQAGDVKEVNILKKSNGKLVGCGFVQYQNVFQAAQAIKELNLKPFLGRPIAVDWALPKQKYQTDDERSKNMDTAAEAINDQLENDTVEIKDEQVESESESTTDNLQDLDNYGSLKEEPSAEVKEEKVDVDEISEERRMRVKRKFKTESDSEDDESDSDDSSADRKFQPKRKKELSNDVEEGKTIFLRNLSFDITEDEMKTFFEKYGQIYYALLCKDRLTEHPKGTGFIKFKRKAAADEVLQEYHDDPGHFTLGKRQFNVSLALSREKVDNKPQQQQTHPRDKKVKTDNKPKSDSRNLYLVREGFIRPGSAAAADVSAPDMNKRASLNRVKKQMLKNLNIIISPTRLCIHNLTTTFSDKQLRKLFLKHAGPGAKITEARIMRDMTDVDLNGKGKSKEYGFVNFTEHEHALTALRNVNNNPSIFKPTHRPIVEFSLENRLALQAKEKRTQKSKEKNPNKSKRTQQDTAHESDSDHEEEEASKSPSKKSKKKKKGVDKKLHESGHAQEVSSQDTPQYVGLRGKKGVQTVPSFKPKGKITRNSLKPKKSKNTKQKDRRMREPKTRSKRPVEKMDKTEKIISKYKQKMASDRDGGKRKKWFD